MNPIGSYPFLKSHFSIKKKELKNYAFIKTGRYDSRLKQIAEKTDMHMKFSSSNQVLYDARGIAVSQNGIYLFN